MNYKRIKNDILLVLKKDDDVFEEITKFAIEQKIDNAFIMGLGALKMVELGFYHLNKKEYSRKEFPSDMELLSLNGNITLVDNKPFAHIHAILGDDEFKCIGGHLFKAKVAVTCEIRLTIFNSKVQRILNESIGLKLVNCNI